MDEHLIQEVERHGVIYNRQKKSIGIKAENIGKEFAWADIANRLRSDVDTCKKRWKYLRERYVQQKKQGDTGHMYEHLSRPYLEKMKFLDRYIQPRKSYRGLITNMANGNPINFELPDSSKSNSSSIIPTANVLCRLAEDFCRYDEIKEEGGQDMGNSQHNLHPATSAIKEDQSPLVSLPTMLPFTSPPPTKSHTDTNSTNINSNSFDEPANSEDESTDNHSNERISTDFVSNGNTNGGGGGGGYPIPFPYTPPNFNHNYTNLHHKPPYRTSDELLGELVTTELMKMSGDRKKNAQKKILQILFFDE